MQHAFLLVVDIDEVKLAGAGGKGGGNSFEEAAHDGGAKGIEEKDEARSRREWVFRRIAAHHARGGACAARGSPVGQVAAGNAGQRGVEFDTDNRAKRHLRGQQQCAAHAGADINEGELVQIGGGLAALPALQQGLKDRGRDAIIGRGVAVVAVAAFEVAACHQPAGAHAVLEVEWVAGEAVGNGQAGEQSPRCGLVFYSEFHG